MTSKWAVLSRDMVESETWSRPRFSVLNLDIGFVIGISLMYACQMRYDDGH